MVEKNKFKDPESLLDMIADSTEVENIWAEHLNSALVGLEDSDLIKIHDIFLKKQKGNDIKNMFNGIFLTSIFDNRIRVRGLVDDVKEKEDEINENIDEVKKNNKNKEKEVKKTAEKIKNKAKIQKKKKEENKEKKIEEVKQVKKETKKIVEIKKEGNNKFIYEDGAIVRAEFLGPFDTKSKENSKRSDNKKEHKKEHVEPRKEIKPEAKSEKTEDNHDSNKLETKEVVEKLKTKTEQKESKNNLPSRTKSYPELIGEGFLKVMRTGKIKTGLKKVNLDLNQNFKLTMDAKNIGDDIELQLYKLVGIKTEKQYKPQKTKIIIDELSYIRYFSDFELDSESQYFDENLYPIVSRISQLPKNTDLILDWFSLRDIKDQKEFDKKITKEMDKYFELSTDATKTIKIQRMGSLLERKLQELKKIIYKQNKRK